MRLEFTRSPDGRTFLARQHAAYPFHICRALYTDDVPPGLATVYTQSCSGGIFRGDCLRLAIECGEGSEAHVTTQASTIVHRTDAEPAEQETTIRVRRGSHLEYRPDPTILFPGAGLRSRLAVILAAEASVVLTESILCHSPAGNNGVFDHYAGEIRIIDEEGKLRALDRMAVRGSDFVRRRPGVTGRASCLGTLMLLALDRDPAPALAALRQGLDAAADGVHAGASVLPGHCGVWCRIAAADAVGLRRTLSDLWRICRALRTGVPPAERRK